MTAATILPHTPRFQSWGMKLKSLLVFTSLRRPPLGSAWMKEKETCTLTSHSAFDDTQGSSYYDLHMDSFAVVLENPSTRHEFKRFLKKEHAADNLSFWEECRLFRSLENASERQLLATAIVYKYLLDNAPNAIHIDVDVKKKALRRCRKELVPSDTFLACEQYIEQLMSDSFTRFIQQKGMSWLLTASHSSDGFPRYTGHSKWMGRNRESMYSHNSAS
eukprot:comp52801_c0_seq1/m.47705 comp52801_c0_seq1/g.47705  ORF comp52801_c0_seq1/g.47705 comp52801_c0_seq1/m.47705 type:complete len:219 (-) comp52801_c0_seq1:442-1098(-)